MKIIRISTQHLNEGCYLEKTFSGKKYELNRHHSGIYFVRKAAGQGPMGSSEVKKLVDDNNKLKHQLKVTRQNNQRLKKTVHDLNSLNETNAKAMDNLKSKIQV